MTPVPTRDALGPLLELSARDYGRWLSVGLVRYLIDRNDVRTVFPGAENYVGWYDAIEQDLAIIFNALNEQEQAAFRAGVHIALGEVATVPERFAKIAVPLMRLAALISAFDVVDVLPALVAASQPLADEDRESISMLALDLAIELAAPTIPAAEALSTVLALVTAPGFSDQVAGSALIALTRTDPNGLPGHLNLLEKPLNAQYGIPLAASGEEPWIEEEKDELLAMLVSLAPAQALLRAFHPNERNEARTSDWEFYDWFCSGLMESRHPAVKSAAEKVLLLERAYPKNWPEVPPEPQRTVFAAALIPKWSKGRHRFQITGRNLDLVVAQTMGPSAPCAGSTPDGQVEFAE